MEYTDSEMIMATQIAYLDADPSLLRDGGCRVSDLIAKKKEEAEGEEKERAELLEKRIRMTPGARNCGDWIIRDVCDDQKGSGMYACLLETSSKEAVIAFRGSESDNLNNVVKDWGMSDLGLLNSMLTPQQLAAEAYTEELYQNYGKEYTSFSFAGHSLGGNLAEHAAITAPTAMRDQIGSCRNLDGPGFSHVYLTAHADEIRDTASKIRHDQWSLVGALLLPAPGTDQRTVAAFTPDMGNPVQSLLWRHDTQTLLFTEEGNFIAGKKDPLAKKAELPSRNLDLALYLLHLDSVSAGFLAGRMRREQRTLEKKQLESAVLRASGGVASVETGRTAVCTEVIAEAAETAQRIASGLRQAAEQAEASSRGAGSGSAEAAVCRGQVCSSAEALEKDSRALSAWAERGTAVCQIYESVEQETCGLLPGVKGGG